MTFPFFQQSSTDNPPFLSLMMFPTFLNHQFLINNLTMPFPPFLLWRDFFYSGWLLLV
jgi:hypothetical protein